MASTSGVLNRANTLEDWTSKGSQNTSIERLMDDAAYASAHPDDTLVLAGPPRLPSQNVAGTSAALKNMVAVGMVQNISVNQQKPFQPLMAIGSSRTFFVGGKAQGSAQIQRLFMNTENLMRRLYTDNIVNGEIAPFTSPGSPGNQAADNENQNYLINLDSEFFLVPFGLGILFKDKVRNGIGGFYMELAVIPNFSVAVQSGQSMIMEACTVFFDRCVPIPSQSASDTYTAYQKVITSAPLASDSIKGVANNADAASAATT